jgi:hypothetical protein
MFKWSVPDSQSISLSIAFVSLVLALNSAPGHDHVAHAQDRNNPAGPVEDGQPAGGGAADDVAGQAKPVQVFTDAQGRTCRVYVHTVTIEGAPKTALATVCRESNGRWVLSR